MAYTPWYKTGTIAIANGSPNLVGSGTAWLSNAQQGQGVLLPDGKTYEITAIASEGAMTVAPNYSGATVVSGGAYAIQPFQGFAQSAAIALTNLLSAAG